MTPEAREFPEEAGAGTGLAVAGRESPGTP